MSDYNSDFLREIMEENENDAQVYWILYDIKEHLRRAEDHISRSGRGPYLSSIKESGVACEAIAKLFLLKKNDETRCEYEKLKKRGELMSQHILLSKSYVDNFFNVDPDGKRNREEIDLYCKLFVLKDERNGDSHSNSEKVYIKSPKKEKGDISFKNQNGNYWVTMDTKKVYQNVEEYKNKVGTEEKARERHRCAFEYLGTVLSKCGLYEKEKMPRYHDPEQGVLITKELFNSFVEDVRADGNDDAVRVENEIGLEESYDEKNTKSATELDINELKKRAEEGDAEAIFELSSRYREGDGVIKNEAEFFRLLKISANAGYAPAQNRLGYCYEYGIATEISIEKAVDLYKIAAAKGNDKGQSNLGRLYESGKGVEKDVDEAIRLLKLSADQGNQSALNRLGIFYEFGTGEEKNISKAIEFYKKSAEKNYAPALCNLGYLYELGKGVEQSYEIAFDYYSKSAEQGFSRAQVKLGCLYKEGKGTEENIEKAVDLFTLASEQGYSDAQDQLGDIYYNGILGEPDYDKALKYYQLAADSNNKFSEFSLGLMYEHGRGVDQDYATAIDWYRKSAENGHAGAKNNLGIIYENGYGIEPDIQEAIRLYSSAADDGNACAKYNLALLYKNGNGVETNLDRAFLLFKEAAEAGDKMAICMLGEFYYYGYAVEKNEEEAFKMFFKAANEGYVQAQTWTGYCFQYGKGVAIDIEKAEHWYKKAVNQGSSWAEFRLGLLYREEGRYKDAVYWLTSASNNDITEAAYELGLCYYEGNGVEKDYTESFNLFRKAAESNNGQALLKLGESYRYGRGVSIDEDKAVSCYRKASDQGVDEAALFLHAIDEYKQIYSSLNPLKSQSASKTIKRIYAFINNGYLEEIFNSQRIALEDLLLSAATDLEKYYIKAGIYRYEPDLASNVVELKKLFNIVWNTRNINKIGTVAMQLANNPEEPIGDFKSEELVTVESFLADNPEVYEIINQAIEASQTTGCTIEIKENELIYNYDLDKDDEPKGEVNISVLKESIKEHVNSVEEIYTNSAFLLRFVTEVQDAKVVVKYKYRNQLVFSRTFFPKEGILEDITM